MFKILRIVCTVLSAVAVAPAIFLGVFLGLPYFLTCASIALIFFGGTLIFKTLQESQEQKEAQKNAPPTPDFFHPVKKNDEE